MPTKKPKPIQLVSSSIAAEPQIEIPAIAGIQNGRHFFTTMMTAREVARYLNMAAKQGQAEPLKFAGHDRLVQRTIDWKRVDKLIKYILKGMPRADGLPPENTYALASLAVVFDSGLEYEFEIRDEAANFGILRLDPDTRFFTADGQHRSGALQKAIALMEEVGDECIPITMYVFRGEAHLREIFIAFNKFGKVPDQSLMVALDDNSPMAALTRTVAGNLPFSDRFMVEGTSIKQTEPYLIFPLRGFEQACSTFLGRDNPAKDETLIAKTTEFWQFVAMNMPLWQQAFTSEDCSALRRDTLALHLVSIKGIAQAGRQLREIYGWDGYLPALVGLENIDWSRKAPHWQANYVIVDNSLAVSAKTISAIADTVFENCKDFAN